MILLNHYAVPLYAVDIVKRLKSNPRHKHIPVVVLSGTTNDEMVRHCYEAGANSFIRKPASVNEIGKKIGDFVRYWFETVELP